MKKLIFSLCVITISCVSLKSDHDRKISEDEKQIAKDLIQGAFDDLWAAADTTKILKYHTEDFLILEHGEVWDNERIKAYMRGRLADTSKTKRINMMEYISIEKYGPSMQIMYHNRAEFYKKDSMVNKTSWLESAFAIETPNGWRLRMMHSTWNGNK